MTGKDLVDGMGFIEDRFLEEAEKTAEKNVKDRENEEAGIHWELRQRRQRRRRLRMMKTFATAAALVLIVSGGALLYRLTGLRGSAERQGGNPEGGDPEMLLLRETMPEDIPENAIEEDGMLPNGEEEQVPEDGGPTYGEGTHQGGLLSMGLGGKEETAGEVSENEGRQEGVCEAEAAGGLTGMPEEEETAEEPNAVFRIVENSNILGTRLLSALLKEGENVFLSPYSLETVLALLAGCSEKGEQAEELREFLGCADMTEEEYLEGQQLLAESLLPSEYDRKKSSEEQESEGVAKVETANALYVDEKLPLLPSFETLPELLAAYAPEIASGDLSTEAMREEINRWGEEKTQGLIPEILEEPFDETVMAALLNSLYFKGYWVNEFNKSMTETQTFYGLDGESEVQMMHASQEKYDYRETKEYQILSLPYRGRYEMRLYLPKDVSVCEKWTDAAYLRELMADVEPYPEDAGRRSVILSLPKFEMEYSADLALPLMEMGLEQIFSGQIYDRISNTELAIDRILQKTAIKINEAGTEAAAVTLAMLAGGAMPESETPVTFTVDHPFLFTITSTETGLHLFTGAILNL